MSLHNLLIPPSSTPRVYGSPKKELTPLSVTEDDQIIMEWEYIALDEQKTPSNRNCHAFAVDDSNKIAYMFGGRSSDRKGCNNQIYAMTSDVIKGWSLIQPSNPKLAPKPRKSCGFAWANNKLWLFGGSTQHYCLNDFWCFDIEKRTWHMIMDDMGFRPEARAKHSMTAINGCLYVFGGTTGRPADYLNDIFVYDIAQNTWSEPETSSHGPRARVDHVACGIQNGLLVHGGKCVGRACEDYWRFDVSRNKWEEVLVTGSDIPQRWGHSVSVYRDRFVLMFGGWDNEKCMDDLWVLDSKTWCYIGIDVGDSRPFPRTYHTSGILGDLFLVCAGRSETARLRDTHVLDLSSLKFLDSMTGLLPKTPLATKYRRRDPGIDKNSFLVHSVLGTGSFGKVQLVEYAPNGKRVEDDDKRQVFAMKMMSKKYIFDVGQVEHVMQEKRIMLSIEHPFIVGLAACFQDDVYVYLVMEYIAGGEFFRLMRRAKRFSFVHAQFYAAQVALMLAHLHECGIVYRDLKPENLLVDRDGYLKLTDFGFASDLDERENGMCLTLCGTVEYMAPEIISGNPYGFSVDWWCLGILIYEMMTGRTPFKGSTTGETFANIARGTFGWPARFDDRAKSMVSQLLSTLESRLGRKGGAHVMIHPFFNEIDWPALANKEVPAPFLPLIESIDDTSNFSVPPNQRHRATDDVRAVLSSENSHVFDEF